MPFIKNLTFYPKRVLADDDETGQLSHLAYGDNDQLLLGRGISFSVGHGAGKNSNVLGSGGFGTTYLVDGTRWLCGGARSFETRHTVSVSPGEFGTSDFESRFTRIRFGALKVFQVSETYTDADGNTRTETRGISIPLDTLRAAQSGDSKAWEDVANLAKPAVDEFRTLATANGANGHAPRPYALGWVEDGDMAYPAILMEYLGKLLIPEGANQTIMDAESLHNALHEVRRDVRARIATQAAIKLCVAVRNLHRTGIAHRDLSRRNALFLCTGSGSSLAIERAFFIDLGNSFAPRDGSEVTLFYRNPADADGPVNSHPHAMPRLATLGFGAPEMFSVNESWHTWSRRNDAKTDTFSIAAILYYLIDGEPVPMADRAYLINKGVANWTHEDLRRAYPDQGFQLAIEANSSKLLQFLHDIIASCTILDSQYRRDLDWLLARLWDLVASEIVPMDKRHHSYEVLPTYRFACHIALLDEDDYDPLGYLCKYQDFVYEWQLDHQHAGPSTEEAEGVPECNDLNQKTIPSEGNQFAGPVSNPSIALVGVVENDRIPIRVGRRWSKMRPANAADAPRQKLLSDAEFARTCEEYLEHSNVAQALEPSASFETALHKMRKGDYNDALKYLRIAFSQGCYLAPVCYAWILQQRKSLRQLDESLLQRSKDVASQLAKAVAVGCTDALCALGVLLAEEGTPYDWEKARTLFDIGFSRQDCYCAYNLGVLHYLGHGVEQDLEEAQRYFMMGYELGCTDGLLGLALYELNKDDSTASFNDALGKLIQAYDYGSKEALTLLWSACERKGWPQEQIAGRSIAGHPLDRRWLQRLIEQRHLTIKPEELTRPAYVYPDVGQPR